MPYGSGGQSCDPRSGAWYASRTELGMPRAKLIVFAAMALLFVQLQCTAACATQLCTTDFDQSENLPPCHRHHHSPHDQPSGSCVHRIVVVTTPSQQLSQIELPQFSVMNVAEPVLAVVLADSRTIGHSHTTPSPPGLEGLSAVVLRI